MAILSNLLALFGRAGGLLGGRKVRPGRGQRVRSEGAHAAKGNGVAASPLPPATARQLAPQAPPRPEGVIESLVHDLQHGPSATARWWAANDLGDLGPLAAAAVPALTEALRDRSPSVCLAATEALGAIGHAAVLEAPAQKEALAHARMRVAEIKEALRRIASRTEAINRT